MLNPNFLYHVITLLFRVACNLFYSTVNINGKDRVPKHGQPTLLCFNHGNSLGDPIVLMQSTPRVIRFCAKDTLWKLPFLGALVKYSGAVPVFRAKEHTKDVAKELNQDMFRAVYKALDDGECVGFAPEGASRFSPVLANLKFGTAHIALESVARNIARDRDYTVAIQPTCLSYSRREKFRSAVAVIFTEPIIVDRSWLSQYPTRKEAAHALTDVIRERLQSATINAPDWKYVRLAMTAARIHRPFGTLMTFTEYMLTLRGWVEALKFLVPPGDEGPDNQHVAEATRRLGSKLWDSLLKYQELLDAYELKDERIRRMQFKSYTKGSLLRRFLWRMLLSLLFGICAAPGLLLWSPFWVLVKYKERRLLLKGPTFVDSVAEMKMTYAFGFVLLVLVCFNVFAPLVLIWMLFTLRCYEEGMASARSMYSLVKLLSIHWTPAIHTLHEQRDLVKELVMEVVVLGILPENAESGDYKDDHRVVFEPSARHHSRKHLLLSQETEKLMPGRYGPLGNFHPWKRTKKDWNETLRFADTTTMNYVE